jgi:ring-1,2-phenylacetyl-CoA epoxidase subunit PaaE
VLHFHPLRLASRTPIAADAYALTFDVPADLREAYEFAPGQHLAVRAQVNGKQLRRTYSIVTPPGGPLSIGVRVQGAMSRFLAEQLHVGDTLDVMTPNGHFTTALDPAVTRSYVAFAAGSGITPVLSLASAVLETEPHSHFRLFYCNRDIEHAMFLPEVLALKDRYLTRFVVHFIMSREPQDAELFNGRLDGAKVKALAGPVFDAQAVDEYFLCGPGTMVDDLQRTLVELGVRGRVHVERFAAAPRGTAIEPRAAVATTPAMANGEVEVVVQMDGRRRSFSMPSTGQTVLEAGEAAGLELPFSCRDGICATCRAKVIDGAVTMTRNQGLEQWELDAGFVLCCQARPTTPRLHLSYDEK